MTLSPLWLFQEVQRIMHVVYLAHRQNCLTLLNRKILPKGSSTADSIFPILFPMRSQHHEFCVPQVFQEPKPWNGGRAGEWRQLLAPDWLQAGSGLDSGNCYVQVHWWLEAGIGGRECSVAIFINVNVHKYEAPCGPRPFTGPLCTSLLERPSSLIHLQGEVDGEDSSPRGDLV